jgi:hypothetical protein
VTPPESAAGGEPCADPTISLHSHHVSLVQWIICLLPITRDPGSNPLGGYLCETGILLLALSRYSTSFLHPFYVLIPKKHHLAVSRLTVTLCMIGDSRRSFSSISVVHVLLTLQECFSPWMKKLNVRSTAVRLPKLFQTNSFLSEKYQPA